MVRSVMLRLIKTDLNSLPIYLIIYTDNNLSVNCNIGCVSKLKIEFSKGKVFCDQQTFDILTNIGWKNLELVEFLPSSIYIFIYDHLMLFNNIETDSQFFEYVKKYLSRDNQVMGSEDLLKRIRPLIDNLMNSPMFLLKNEALWISFSKNTINPYTHVERGIFITKMKQLITEIVDEKNYELKKKKHIELEKLYKAENHLKKHIFRIK